MMTLVRPARPPNRSRATRHVVVHITTVTREITRIDAPAFATRSAALDLDGFRCVEEDESAKTVEGLNRLYVRLGAWLIELSHRRAVRPTAGADEIARRVEEAKARDLSILVGLKN